MFECLFHTMSSVCLREFIRRLSDDPEHLQIFYSLPPSFMIDTMMIMEFNICLTESEDIPLDHLFSRRAMLATANCSAIRKVLGNPDKRRLMEKLIDDMGLEHLGGVRYIRQGLSRRGGDFIDVWGDDTRHVVVRKF